MSLCLQTAFNSMSFRHYLLAMSMKYAGQKTHLCKNKMYPLADILICMLLEHTKLSSVQVLAIANRLMLLEAQQIPTARLREFYFLLNHYYLCILNLIT